MNFPMRWKMNVKKNKLFGVAYPMFLKREKQVMREFSHILGWHLLVIFLSPLFGGFLAGVILSDFKISSCCSFLLSNVETMEGRIVGMTDPYRGSDGRNPIGPLCKIEYIDKQRCKQFFYAAEQRYFFAKKIGDSITFKTDGNKIIIESYNDAFVLFGFSFFLAIMFPFLFWQPHY